MFEHMVKGLSNKGFKNQNNLRIIAWVKLNYITQFQIDPENGAIPIIFDFELYIRDFVLIMNNTKVFLYIRRLSRI